MRAPIEQVVSISRLICGGCGSETNATCNCGMEYRPKAVRAREAVEASPEKSNMDIARETGADEKEVRRQRSKLSSDMSEDPRTRRAAPRKRPAEDDSTYEDADVAQARKGQRGTAGDADSGATITETDTRERKRRERGRMKEALPEGEDDERITLGDYFELDRRIRKLEARNNELSAAFNAKEKTEGRNWPVDMTPKQIKLRDKLLKYIAWNQRDLEQLYGEVTGQPSWRVEVTTKDGARLGTGARFGTQGEAEFYNTHFATSQLEGNYATGDVIPCKEEANVLIEGDAIRFAHGDCVLLNWLPITDPAPAADLNIPDYLKRSQ
jgi:hypothetical protein